MPDSSAAGATGDADAEQFELVRRAQRGDRDAFAVLYERYMRLVHGVLLARGETNDTDDLVQDVFLTAMNRLPTLRDPAAFGAWLCSIARNAAGMKRRKRLRLLPLTDDVPAPASADEGLDGSTVMAAIHALPEAYRETLVLRLVEGMGGEEIARRTGLTHGSVRVNLHRGMAMLRALLGAAP